MAQQPRTHRSPCARTSISSSRDAAAELAARLPPLLKVAARGPCSKYKVLMGSPAPVSPPPLSQEGSACSTRFGRGPEHPCIPAGAEAEAVQCLLHCAEGCCPTLLCSALPCAPAHVEGSRSPPRAF